MPFRYIPLLRSKAGEATALSNLTAQVKQRMLPLIHVAQRPPSTFAQRLSQAWAGLPLALDGLFNYSATGSQNDFVTMFRTLGRNNVNVIPSVECDAPQPYVAIVQRLIGQHATGLVVKVTPRQLGTVSAWVGAQGWQQSDVDLIINLESIAGYGDPVQFGAFIQHAIVSALPGNAPPWRSVTLASSAAPKDHGALPLGRTNLPRLDWQLWQNVHTNVPFQLDYGDYGTAHPGLTEPPGVAMARATVSVRYTIDDFWIVLKGRPIGGRTGQAMPRQYHGHATTLVADPQFGGLPGCWGDQRIQQILAGTGTPGSRTTWVEIGANRHLSLVANRLP
jgi:hypothetical protein